MRFNFVATIRTAGGHKKVLIEIQKSQNAVDLMRFRAYQQYIIEKYGQKIEEPITLEERDRLIEAMQKEIERLNSK